MKGAQRCYTGTDERVSAERNRRRQSIRQRQEKRARRAGIGQLFFDKPVR